LHIKARRQQGGQAATQGAEDDGDGAVGKLFGKLSSASKGFGTEGIALVGAVGVAGAAFVTGGQDGAESGVLAARAGAEGGLAFIEQEGGDIVVETLSQRGGGEANGQGRAIRQEAEQLQTQRLAGLLPGRLDGKIGRDAYCLKAMGVEAP